MFTVPHFFLKKTEIFIFCFTGSDSSRIYGSGHNTNPLIRVAPCLPQFFEEHCVLFSSSTQFPIMPWSSWSDDQFFEEHCVLFSSSTHFPIMPWSSWSGDQFFDEHCALFSCSNQFPIMPWSSWSGCVIITDKTQFQCKVVCKETKT